MWRCFFVLFLHSVVLSIESARPTKNREPVSNAGEHKTKLNKINRRKWSVLYTCVLFKWVNDLLSQLRRRYGYVCWFFCCSRLVDCFLVDDGLPHRHITFVSHIYTYISETTTKISFGFHIELACKLNFRMFICCWCCCCCIRDNDPLAGLDSHPTYWHVTFSIRLLHVLWLYQLDCDPFTTYIR